MIIGHHYARGLGGSSLLVHISLLLLFVRVLGGQRQACQDARSALPNRFDPQRSAQLLGALAHRAHPYPSAAVLRYARSVVGNSKVEGPSWLVDREFDAAGAGPGVTHNISHRLLVDTVCCHLDGRRQRWQVLWSLHGEEQPVLMVRPSCLRGGIF